MPDALPYLFFLAVAAALIYWLYPVLVVVPGALFFFVAWFFRNPPRRISSEPDIVVSPADGVIVGIEDAYEPHYLKSQAKRITIFLNIFNVHVNRMPVAGNIEFVEYKPGEYLAAYREEAALRNEQTLIGIYDGRSRYLVKQVAGLIARRIVCWPKVGDAVARGDIFGLIKFGSCTELYLPMSSMLEVGVKDRVRGGETIIGRLRNEENTRQAAST